MAKRRSSSTRASQYVNDVDRERIELARARFKQAESADEQQREREQHALAFYAGEQWPQAVKNAREGFQLPGTSSSGPINLPPRPTLTINKVREPVRQVLNQERQAELGVEIAAVDDFGDESSAVTEQEITVREGLVRRIQRESQAVDARSWAFQRAVIAGRGFYRVMTRYVAGSARDQEVYVDRIYNQASVSLDPAHEQPDGSDAEWGFIGTDLPWDRYTADYGTIGDKPNKVAKASDGEWRALGDEMPGWFSTSGKTRSVRVVEYFYTERTQRTLVQLVDGRVVYEDEAPDGIALQQDEDGQPITRPDIVKQIKWLKLDGVQILEETDWPGKYLPIIKVVAEELQPYDNQRRSDGMVNESSMDSNYGFNAMVSKWVEQVGLAPIPPWMGAAGFDEGFEQEYAIANTRALPALHFNPRGLDGQEIAPPARTSIRMEIEAIAGSIQLFDQAIKSTTAVPDATLGNIDPTIRSNRQLKTALEQARQGTSHYLDNLGRSIRYEGLILNDLLQPIYGTPGRKTRMMNPRGETKPVLLHKAFVPHPETQAPQQMMNGMPVTEQTPGAQTWTLSKDATFNVTVKVTKNYDTRREEQESVLSTLVQADPQQMLVVGDLLFKYNDGPGHEELEQRYKAMLAPPVQAVLKGQQAPDPQMLQLQAENAQLKQMVQTKTAEIQAKGQIDLQQTQMKEQGDTQRTAAELQVALQKAEIAAAASMSNAQAKVDAENFRSYVDALETKLSHSLDLHMADLKAHLETTMQGRDHVHEHLQGTLDRQHEAEMAAQQHNNALEQGQQAAALAPEPSNNGAGA